MSTYIINLNDTIALSDSAVVELAKVVGAWQPCVQETHTSRNDVLIVIAICATIIIVVGLITWVLKTWISGKNKYQMAEHEEKCLMNEVERNKQNLEIELRRQDAESVRQQKKKVDELKNRKTEQDLTIEKWDAEHKKAESELHRERYKQETEQAKLDAELERKIKGNESENGKK